MVQSTDITLISSTTTLSGINDVYLLNAGATGFNVTLPTITSDGMNYKLIRNDTSSSLVTIQGTGGNLIFQNIGLTGNYNIIPQTVVEFQSYNNNWYMTTNSSLNRSTAKSLFTAAFIQNNGTPNVTFSGTATPQIVCSFYYPGLRLEVMTSVTFVLSSSGGNPIGTASVTTQAGAIIASVAFNIASATATVFTDNTITLANLPLTPAVLEYRVTFPGNANKLNVYSLTIQ